MLPRVALILIISFLACCERNDSDLFMVQKIIFHFSYDNYSVGHQFNGWFIDNSGNVWNTKYSTHWCKEEMNIITNKNEELWISKNCNEYMYSYCRDSIIITVNLDSIKSKFVLIENLLNTRYSKPRGTGNDMGSYIYGCLYYDQNKEQYKRIILKSWGDYSFVALDTTASELISWIKRLETEIKCQEVRFE
jgi:hypothetical protein